MTLPNPDRKRFPVVSQCLAHEVEIEEEKYGKTEKVKVPMPDCNKVFRIMDSMDHGNAESNIVCICYGNPSNMWRLGCPMASNKIQITAKGKPINPLKASKRQATTSFSRKRKNR